MSRSVTNVMEKINKLTGEININYDMTIGNMKEIHKNSNETFDLISNSFKFGYIQGMEAEKARQKLKKKTA